MVSSDIITKYLVERGYWVRGVDIKEPEYEATAAHDFALLDLTRIENCVAATRASIRFTAWRRTWAASVHESHKAEIVRDNTLINLQTIEAARQNGDAKISLHLERLYLSSYKQKETDITPLKEDAYPAEAEDGYGWEKLYMERVCRHYSRISVWIPASYASTTSLARWAPTTAGARNHRRRFVARLLWRKTWTKSKFGAMACKRDRTVTSMIASKEFTG